MHAAFKTTAGADGFGSISMKKVLVVKTSSLGDVIHTLPALSDAARVYPSISFDWLVEQGFSEIPSWHPQVARVIPVAWRRWRKNLWRAWRDGEIQQWYKNLRAERYDAVIDAQGLLKSALMARIAVGAHCGLDFSSARESMAALFYQRRYPVIFQQHAVTRARQLFAHALNYPCPDSAPDYAIRAHFPLDVGKGNTILLVHGTTWTTKEWPEPQWIGLAKHCVAAGFTVQLPWGNAVEKARAERIAAADPGIEVLPKTSLSDLAQLLLNAKAVVAVDTGIGHLAAALSVPTLSLYGPTDPEQIGARGDHQIHLRKINDLPGLTVEEVWEGLQPLLGSLKIPPPLKKGVVA